MHYCVLMREKFLHKLVGFQDEWLLCLSDYVVISKLGISWEGIHAFRSEKCLFIRVLKTSWILWCKASRAQIQEQGQPALSGRVRLRARGSQAAVTAAQLLAGVLRADCRNQESHQLCQLVSPLTYEDFHRICSPAQASRWCIWSMEPSAAMSELPAVCTEAGSLCVCTGSCSDQGSWTATETG